MTFGQPLWFWAFALFPVLLALFFRSEARRGKLLRQLVAARLQERLAGSVSVGRRRFRFLLLLLGVAGVIGALAQPRLGYTWEQSQRKGRDVLLAIDCSKSMLATDLAPSRLGRAKLAAQDLLGQLEGDRAGLIAFAGSAFLQAPLTVDYGAVLTSLAEVDTDLIPRGGTNIAAAIKTAVEAFGKGESEHRALILFTDGEELDEDAVQAAAALNGAVRIYTVGIGSADGSLIPVPGENGGTDFVKDESGQIVKSRLDEERLRKIAESTGGFYVHLASGLAEMQQLARDGLGQMKEQDIDARMSRRPIERYQWPLAAGLVLLASALLVGERKRTARRGSGAAQAAALLLVMSGLVSSAQAGLWSWKNPGLERYENGVAPSEEWAKLKDTDAAAAEKARLAARQEFEAAHAEFSRQLQRRPDSPELNFNLGAAAYKLGNNDEALLAFSKATLTDDPKLRVNAESNLANTLYQKGLKKKETDKQATLRDWKDGLKHYDDALSVQPNNKLVQGYREFLRREIEKLEKEPPKSEDKKEQDKKDEQKEDKKNEEQKQPKDGQEKSDQKQNPKDQGKQDEQKPQEQKSQGDQPQPQNQDKSGDQKSGQQGKDDPKDGKQDDQRNGDKGEKKDARNDPQKQEQAKNGPGEKGEQPQPAPDQPEKKRAGDIQPQNGQPPQPSPEEQQAAAEAQAAEEGKMTEAQAASLLESLKNEDTKVQLLKPGEKRAGGRVWRDW